MRSVRLLNYLVEIISLNTHKTKETTKQNQQQNKIPTTRKHLENSQRTSKYAHKIH